MLEQVPAGDERARKLRLVPDEALLHDQADE